MQTWRLKSSMDKALVQAAARGDVSNVEELLSHGARVDARDEQGFTPLLSAAKRGHTEVCQLLLETGKANVEETVVGPSLLDGDTALMLAAHQGHASTVAVLLSKGAKVDAKDKHGFTPLLAAANERYTEVCEVLLDKGKANIEETDPEGNTALMLAFMNPITVALLLSKGAEVDKRDHAGFSSLIAAVQLGDTEVCKLLLKSGKANVNEKTPKGLPLLHVAVQYGHAEVCELLLANGSDLKETEPHTLNNALHEAAITGHKRIIQLLLSHKVDVNSRNRRGATPLLLASQEGHVASVVSLLQAGADPLLPTHNGALPIDQAAQKNQSEVVRILIEQGGCSPDQVRHTVLLSIDQLFLILESLCLSVGLSIHLIFLTHRISVHTLSNVRACTLDAHLP